MTQDSLFDNTNDPSLADGGLLDGLQYQERFLPPDHASGLFERLIHQLDWQQPSLTISGKRIPIPRLQSWQGDGRLSYQYSGETFVSQDWHPDVLSLKERVEQQTQTRFNAVLCNLYRNERDSVSWHADDEPELGPSPIIASVSLGATRSFQIKHKIDAGKTMKLNLKHNSLLIMPAGFQAKWLHQLPKISAKCGARVNLTFRYIN